MTFHSSKSWSKCIAGQINTHSTRQINSKQGVSQTLLSVWGNKSFSSKTTSILNRNHTKNSKCQHTTLIFLNLKKKPQNQQNHKTQTHTQKAQKKVFWWYQNGKRDFQNVSCITAVLSEILESSPEFYFQLSGSWSHTVFRQQEINLNMCTYTHIVKKEVFETGGLVYSMRINNK